MALTGEAIDLHAAAYDYLRAVYKYELAEHQLFPQPDQTAPAAAMPEVPTLSNNPLDYLGKAGDMAISAAGKVIKRRLFVSKFRKLNTDLPISQRDARFMAELIAEDHIV